MAAFGKLITAMVTPFRADLSLDTATAGRLATKLADEGSEGIVVSGTTGESATLSASEKLALLEAVLEAVGDRVAVIAGTGTNSTAQTMELTRAAEAAGAHGLLVVSPYYNRPPQEGLFRHFQAVAGSTSLPVMVYNVPGRTGQNMEAGTVLRLAQIPNITAVKEASGNLDQVTDIIRGAPQGFQVYSGDDKLLLALLALGAAGVVSVASHLVGRKLKALLERSAAGDPPGALSLHNALTPLFRALFITSNPIPLKHALRRTGFDCGGVRPPLVDVTQDEAAAIDRALTAACLL